VERSLIMDLGTMGAAILVLLVVLVIVDVAVRFFVERSLKIPGMKTQEDSLRAMLGRLRIALLFTGTVGSVAILGGGAYIISTDETVLGWLGSHVARIPMSFWLSLLGFLAELAVVFVAVSFIRRLVVGVFHAIGEAAKRFEGLHANEESIDHFTSSVSRNLGLTLYVIGVWGLTRLWGAPESIVNWAEVASRVSLVLVAGLAMWRALDAALDTIMALSGKYAIKFNLVELYERVVELTPVVRRSLEWAVYVSTASIALHQVPGGDKLSGHGMTALKLIGLFLATRVVVELSEFVVHRVLIEKAELDPVERQRRVTVIPIGTALVRYTAYFMAGVYACTLFGLDPLPLLAGAGIAGLALSLGAQKIINDTVSGFLILFEDQFLVGDYIEVEGTGASGIVDSITSRTTVLRDLSGRVHVLRNGDLRHVVNYSQDWTNAVVDFRLDYLTHMSRVDTVLERCADAIENDPRVLGRPRWVIHDFKDEYIAIRVITKVEPGQHVHVGRDLRRLILDACQDSDVQLYFIRRIHMRGETPQLEDAHAS